MDGPGEATGDGVLGQTLNKGASGFCLSGSFTSGHRPSPAMAPMQFLCLLCVLFVCTQATVTTMSRRVVGTGFHRELVTQIHLDQEQHRKLIHPDVDTQYTNCTIMLVETLMKGVFLDQYEIHDRERLKVPGDDVPYVHFFREMDVEKPSYLSPSNIVLVYYHFDPRVREQQRVFNISLPIHFRYQLPSSKDLHHKVIISPPLVYLHCNGIPSMPSLDQLGKPPGVVGWNTLTSEDESSLRLVLEIPVGQRESEWMVMTISIAVTLIGAFATIYVVDSVAPPLLPPKSRKAKTKPKTD